MSEAFVDTSGWAAFLVARETFHEPAERIVQEWRRNSTMMVTTNYVVAELVALLTSPIRLPRAQLIATVETIRSASGTELVHIDPATESEAWEMLTTHGDKSWSLTDCTSFVVMRKRRIIEALTSDRHFEQAGFMRLLKK